MAIERLTSAHATGIKFLFASDRHMGLDLKSDYFIKEDFDYNEATYNIFCDTYLADLKNFAAYGNIENGIVTSAVAFYESIDSPCWYWTQVRSIDSKTIPACLDAAMAHNEANGRYKFVSMFNAKYAKSYRRLAFSKEAQERYDYVDECIVPAKTKCFYQDYWQILFNRTLVPVDSLVRCAFLKQQYRTELPILGGL